MPRQKTKSGRPIHRQPRAFTEGNPYSEYTVTFPQGGQWYTFPSVDDIGGIIPQHQIESYIAKHGPTDPITGEVFPSFDTEEQATAYAKKRSATRQ